jgi:hypothetical protein
VFKFAAVTAVDDLGGTVTIVKKLIAPNGTQVGTESSTTAGTIEYTLDTAGNYKVRYEATDTAGNVAVKEFTIIVVGTSVSTVNVRILSTILIIVAILLVIFILLYFFRFRKIKETAHA